MEQQLFELTRDFYTLRKEYEVNMQNIQKSLQRLESDNSRLTKTLNELRDVVAEMVEGDKGG